MIATKIVFEAMRKDRNRFKVSAGSFVTRDMRWHEVLAYCRRRDAEKEAALDREYGPRRQSIWRSTSGHIIRE